jgi:hypothetical protein
LDQRLGKASGKQVPADRAEEMEALYRERYQGFTVKHFHEHLAPVAPAPKRPLAHPSSSTASSSLSSASRGMTCISP